MRPLLNNVVFARISYSIYNRNSLSYRIIACLLIYLVTQAQIIIFIGYVYVYKMVVDLKQLGEPSKESNNTVRCNDTHTTNNYKTKGQRKDNCQTS